MQVSPGHYANWLRSVEQSEAAVRDGRGAAFLVVVSGSPDDAQYWARRFTATVNEVVNHSAIVPVLSFAEPVPAGNLLGTCRLWAELRSKLHDDSLTKSVGLVSMVVGQGRRLSPFTQCLGGRKAAFPTPRLRRDGAGHLTACEIANLSVAGVLGALRDIDFRGLLVKWGDEALLASNDVVAALKTGSPGDVIRFGSVTQPDERSAAHKEWLVSRRDDGEVIRELPRQPLADLNGTIDALACHDVDVAVNLGSFVISYEVLDAVTDAFEASFQSNEDSADWDPHFWMAFLASSSREWSQLKEREAEGGRFSIAAAEKRCPGIFAASQRARALVERRLRRPFRSTVLDFGETWWADLGNQTALREHFQALRTDSDVGRIGRRIYRIPDTRDENGNLFVRSAVASAAGNTTINNSLVVDAVLKGNTLLIRDGVVIGGEYGDVIMPHGGVALFSQAARLHIDNAAGMVFGYTGRDLHVAAGERRCTLKLPDGIVHMAGHESLEITSSEYEQPVMGNSLSYAQAAAAVSTDQIDDWESRFADGTKAQQVSHDGSKTPGRE